MHCNFQNFHAPIEDSQFLRILHTIIRETGSEARQVSYVHDCGQNRAALGYIHGLWHTHGKQIRGVNHFEQILQFNRELDKLIERVRSEYEMSYESVIGALHLRAHYLCEEASKEEFEDNG